MEIARKRMTRVLALGLSAVLCLTACSNSANQTGGNNDNKQGGTAPTSGSTNISIGTLSAGSSGYNQTSALAEGLAQGGYKVRMVPSGNGINRVNQLLDNTAQYFVGYDEVFLGFEGMAEFAQNKIGPVEMRTVLGNSMGLTMVTTAASGIKVPSDYAGKRVPYVPGDSSVGYKTTALMAFGGVTWDDVTPVPFPSWNESVKGLLSGSVDIAQQACPPSSTIYELAASAQGVAYPIYDHDDEEAWARLHEWAPWIFPVTLNAEDLVGCEGDGEIELAGYVSPSLVTLASTSEEDVYNLVKTLDEQFDVYKDALPEMVNWKVDLAGTPIQSAPIHAGTVKYMKEKGLWTDEYEEWNQEQLKRSEELQAIWETVVKEAEEKNISDEDFEEYWVSRKAETIGGFCKLLPDFMKK